MYVDLSRGIDLVNCKLLNVTKLFDHPPLPDIFYFENCQVLEQKI
jgi:hypothetical protein